MSTFETILLMLLVLDAIALAALVLLQQGRGADCLQGLSHGGPRDSRQS